MSAIHLQRVSVRMLYDPAFVREVYEQPESTLAEVALTAEERECLLATDRRVWGADAMRRKRSLKALLDEFKVSSAIAVAKTRRLATLDAFFSSPIFHRSIQHRGSMALAFADYLMQLPLEESRLIAIAKLERALAKVRRGRKPTKGAGALRDDGRYVLSPHAEPLLLPAGTLDVMNAVEQVLFEISLAPIAALADDGPDLSTLPDLGAPDGLALVAERTEGENAGLGEATAGVVALLETARTPVSGKTLIDAACALGASPAEAREVVQPLLDDRLLVAA
jgi:hypothetical protein